MQRATIPATTTQATQDEAEPSVVHDPDRKSERHHAPGEDIGRLSGAAEDKHQPWMDQERQREGRTVQPNEITEVLNRPISQDLFARD